MIFSSVGQSSSFSGTSEWFCSSELSAWFKNGKKRERERNRLTWQCSGSSTCGSMPLYAPSQKNRWCTAHGLISPQRSSRNMQVQWRHHQLPCVRAYQGTCPVITFNGPAIWSGKKPTLGYGQCRTGTCVLGQSASGEACHMISSPRWPCPKQPRVYPIPRGLGYFQAVILVRVQL